MKKLFLIILIAVALGGGVYLWKNQPPASPVRETSQRPTEEQLPVVTATEVKYRGQDGKNAFELLQATTNVEFKKYSFGVFVESIGGVKPDKDRFWKFYVNGAESQVGADQVQTKSTDLLEWKLSEVTNEE